MLIGKLDQFGQIGLKNIQADPERIIPISLPQETVALGLAYSPLRIDVPPQGPAHHRILQVTDHETGNKLFCKAVSVAEFCEGDEFAVFNEDGRIIGFDKVINLHRTSDDKDSVILLIQNKNSIDYEKADYLISLPEVESDYDTAIVAAMDEKGQSFRTVEYRYDGGTDVKWDSAFIACVTNVDQENGTVEGISLGRRLNDSLEKGFTMEMSVFKQSQHLPFTWEKVTESGNDLVFVCSALNVEVGDVISNCEVDDVHSITCQRITSWKHQLQYIRVCPDQPHRPADLGRTPFASVAAGNTVRANDLTQEEVFLLLLRQLNNRNQSSLYLSSAGWSK